MLLRSAATVADAMIRAPKVCGRATTVAEVCEQFRDDHVHAVLVVHDGKLLSIVERSDLGSAPAHLAARLAGRLHGRIIGPDADLDATRHRMTASGRRRLAVVDRTGRLLGLLCLKRTGTGFCSDADVQARADERRREAAATPTPDTTTRRHHV